MTTTGGSDVYSDIDYETYSDFTTSVYIWNIFPPILIFFGTIGNVLSIIVLRRPKIRKSVCSIYFIALSVSDLLVLYTGLLRQWIHKTFDVDIRHMGSAGCKIHTWLVYFFLDFSSWILVAVTVERVLLVWFPRKATVKCTKNLAKLSLFVIGTCLLLVNSHILYGRGLDVTNTNGSSVVDYTCSFISDHYEDFWTSTWPSVDLTIFCGGPFCFLLIGNILIFLKVLLTKRAVKRQCKNVVKTRKKDSKFSSMSIMLLVVNTTFLLCNTPISVYLIGYETWVQKVHGREYVTLEYLIWSVVNILMYLNNSINFLLYILSGSRFRNEIKSMLIKRRHITVAVVPQKYTRDQLSSTNCNTLNNRNPTTILIKHSDRDSRC